MLEKNVALSIRDAVAVRKARLEMYGWEQMDSKWTGQCVFWRRQGASGMVLRFSAGVSRAGEHAWRRDGLQAVGFHAKKREREVK